MAKYAKNRNYVPPSTKGKTVLVRPSKDKDGVVKTGLGCVHRSWGLIINTGFLEKSKWCQSILHA